MAKKRKKPHRPQVQLEDTRSAYLTRLAELFAVLAGVALIYETAYATRAHIYSAEIDQADPFNFPFYIENRSHVFTIYNLSAACTIVNTDIGIHNVRMSFLGNKMERLEPGDRANYKCPAKATDSHFGTVGYPDRRVL